MKTVILHLTISLGFTLIGSYVLEIMNIISSVVDPVGVEGGFSNEVSE